MLVDEVEAVFKGGKGGDGKASFYPGWKSGPDGGDGGDGGSIYITGSSDLSLLDKFSGKKLRQASDGQPGGKYKKAGKNGSDMTVYLPVGVVLTDLDSGDTFELNTKGQTLLIAKGGTGGRGTNALASPSFTTPFHAEPGRPGQLRKMRIELKLIADYGLIGLPNAGKSSLLNELTRAGVKVADYPFTTLEPNLGVRGDLIIADIPGLIEGASKGRGLGIKFLKHIEKVKLLLHCISAETKDPEKDYIIIREEMESFNPALIKKEEIILLTKADTVSDKELSRLRKLLKKHGVVFLVSLLDDRYDPVKLTIFN